MVESGTAFINRAIDETMSRYRQVAQSETNHPKITGIKLRMYPFAPPGLPSFSSAGRLPPYNTITPF